MIPTPTLLHSPCRTERFAVWWTICLALLQGFGTLALLRADEPLAVRLNGRRPSTEAELNYWLANILDEHRFTLEEAAAALDMSVDDVRRARERYTAADARAGLTPSGSDRIKVLPFPGGRHPRIGFLEGAIDPQRETKVSVFTPWQPTDGPADHVVVDVPEAIWSNLGLTYLAHTHVPTLWTQAGIELMPLEWQRRDDGSLFLQRRLPNGIEFTSHVEPRSDHVAMSLTLTNGTDELLTDLRVQNCVMLKGARGFQNQTAARRVVRDPFLAVPDETGRRWIITAWVPHHRSWGNDRCPCLHSDPRFPDCPPGATTTVHGRLWFYTGDAIDSYIEKLRRTSWHEE